MCMVGLLRLGMLFSFVIEFHPKPIHRMDLHRVHRLTALIDINSFKSLSDCGDCWFMAIEAIRWHDPGSVFDGFASPGPERPSGSSWIRLVTRCHEPHINEATHSLLFTKSIHQHPHVYPVSVHTNSFEGPDVSGRFRAPMWKTTSCAGTRPKPREGPWQCSHLAFCFAAAHSNSGRSGGRSFLYASFGLWCASIVPYPGISWLIRFWASIVANNEQATIARHAHDKTFQGFCACVFSTLFNLGGDTDWAWDLGPLGL